MTRLDPFPFIRPPATAWRLASASILAWGACLPAPQALATTPLADRPVFSDVRVPGNLALVLSAEFPTAISVAHTDALYDDGKTYQGYFDPGKCYGYHWNASEPLRHFFPAGSTTNRRCIGRNNGLWSGNFLNWATMQTIDTFRWVLTGGYRSRDTPTETFLERANASAQGSVANFPNRSLSDGVSLRTPFDWPAFRMRAHALGNRLRFTATGNVDAPGTPYDPALPVAGNRVYELSIRVKVCDPSPGAGGLEPNCTAYPAGSHKPAGLIQRYSDRMRYSVLGYLNDGNLQRDGGVLRARKKFVGPTEPVPGGPPRPNGAAEWDSTTGIMVPNPDPADAANTAGEFGVPVTHSGVMNYLNQFGQITTNGYKTYDPVGELFYAATRYYRNLPNVPEWTSMTGATHQTRATWVDGFPVITKWTDPIQYACQRNFILGIGDVNTHADKNLPGNTPTANEPPKPAAVAADTFVNTVDATNRIGALHGLGNALGTTHPYNGCCNDNSALMSGLAYAMNARDMRPDDPGDLRRTKGRQTVRTYWLDVLEYQQYKPNNPFYLTAKYGGARLPPDFEMDTRTTDLPTAWWRTSGDTVGTGSQAQPRPDTYFTAARPDQVVTGLTRAFGQIAAELKAFSTAFSTTLPQLALDGNASYAASYDTTSWTGELAARTVSFDAATGKPSFSEVWSFTERLERQVLADGRNGWNTRRRIVAWDDAAQRGRPFRWGSLSPVARSLLDTDYRDGPDGADYLDYLRGQRSHEQSSDEVGSARAYRDRTVLVGDIVRARAIASGAPALPFSEGANPGYAAFRSAFAPRRPVVFVGTNAGMLHAVDGRLSGIGAGEELFAYIPGGIFAGPTATPAVNGLKAVGRPDVEHFNRVDAPPVIADIDFGRTVGGGGTDWRTVLVGGLGKGGRRYYALDVTDPDSWASEDAIARNVLWEFSDPDLGFTYGEPVLVKTRAHGWVAILVSGYNNADGQGYFFVVNPRSGQLIAKIGTGVGSPDRQAGMAQVNAFVRDRADGTADAAYAADLLGNLWRLDLGDPAGALRPPQLLARLTDSAGAPLPVTTRPLILLEPRSLRRWVTVGTGRLLHADDIADPQRQHFFAFLDGTNHRFTSADGLPPGRRFPMDRTMLHALADPKAGAALAPDELGWFIDLGGSAAGPGWRIVSQPSGFYGVVSFASTLPSLDDACEPSGSSRVYAIDLKTARSRLLEAPGSRARVAYSTGPSGAVTDLAWRSVAGAAGVARPRLIAATDTGSSDSLPLEDLSSGTLRRMNWREVPLRD